MLTGTIDLSGDYIVKYWTDPTDVDVSGFCFDNSAGTYQGFYPMEGFDVDDAPIVTVTATMSFLFLMGWVLGQDGSLTFIISHEEVFIGQ